MSNTTPESGIHPPAHVGRQRISRIAAIVSATIALTLVATPGAAPASAAGSAKLDRPAQATRFEPAVRRGSVRVAQSTPTSVAGGPSAPKATEPPALSEHERFALEVVRLSNIERIAAGVSPLAAHPKLVEAADAHARDIAGQACAIGVLSHTGSDGSNAGDRILRTGLDISRWAENIACGHTSAESVVDGWMESAGHRENLLDPRLTHIGVDVEESEDGVLFWVQNFATVR